MESENSVVHYTEIGDEEAARIIAAALYKESFDEALPETTTESDLDPIIFSPDNDTSLNQKTFRHRIGQLKNAYLKDYSNSDSKFILAVIGASVLTTQIADRARLSIVLVPAVATSILENTGRSFTAATAGALTYFAWNGIVGEVMTQGLDKHRNLLSSFSENFPGVVNVFTDSLPGVESSSERTNDESNHHKDTSLRDKALLHIKRAGTGIGIGSTAFVGTAAANGYTKKELRRLNLQVSTDASLLTHGVIWGVGESIIQLGKNGHQELSMHIQDVAGDIRVWYGVAAVSMISEFISRRRQRHKESSQQEI